ncbi:MAG: hypothetical protein HKP61_17315 [Dactylosporangium sp.]|nr:hypothetical protein [Dactylosporangium sp.]NNJ62666.1 hypothetical protein [Dactylosporangium sp.]
MAYPGGTPGNEQQSESGYTYPNGMPGYPPVSPEPAPGYVPEQGGYGQYQVEASGPEQPPPPSGQTSTAPMSGSPYAAPGTGAPYAAPGGGPMPPQPTMVGPTMPGQPQPMPMGHPPAGGRSGITVVFGVFMVLFLIVAGVMTGLFISKNNALGDSKKTVSQRDDTISQNTEEIDQLKSEVGQLKDDLDQARTDLTGSQNQADELKRQKQVISRCLELLAEAAEAAEAGDTATSRAKTTEAEPVCKEAGTYLD